MESISKINLSLIIIYETVISSISALKKTLDYGKFNIRNREMIKINRETIYELLVCNVLLVKLNLKR